MTTMASQITSLTVVYSTVYLGADIRKHQSFASLTFVRGIHRGPVNSPDKWPVTRLNKRLSKQPWGLWFETLSRLLWRHFNDTGYPSHGETNPPLQRDQSGNLPSWRPICQKSPWSWWRHDMETLSVLLALCAGNSHERKPIYQHMCVTYATSNVTLFSRMYFSMCISKIVLYIAH